MRRLLPNGISILALLVCASCTRPEHSPAPVPGPPAEETIEVPGGPGGPGDAKTVNAACLPGKKSLTKLVTHYYVPLLDGYDQFSCDKMEGTCIYSKDGGLWLHNFGHKTDKKLREVRCKNGFGNKKNCLNPCRTLAASQEAEHHKFGEIVFIKSLVGKKCGNKRDKTDMIHDGYMIVADTGSSKRFDSRGRFDFFWGRCADKKDGVCLEEGAEEIARAATETNYCVVWDPADPLKNIDVKNQFIQKVRAEALRRGDPGAADDFEEDKSGATGV